MKLLRSLYELYRLPADEVNMRLGGYPCDSLASCRYCVTYRSTLSSDARRLVVALMSGGPEALSPAAVESAEA